MLDSLFELCILHDSVCDLQFSIGRYIAYICVCTSKSKLWFTLVIVKSGKLEEEEALLYVFDKLKLQGLYYFFAQKRN